MMIYFLNVPDNRPQRNIDEAMCRWHLKQVERTKVTFANALYEMRDCKQPAFA